MEILYNLQSLQIGPITLHFYGLMYATGAIVCYFVTKWLLEIEANIEQKTPRLSHEQVGDFVLYTLLGGIIGGRIAYVLLYNWAYFAENLLDIFAVWQGGMSLHGGLAGGALAFFLYCWWNKLPVWSTVDVFVPGIALGLACGRLGNLVNAELLGPVTSLPWGIACAPGSTEMCHPWPLYAILANVMIALITWHAWRQIYCHTEQKTAYNFWYKTKLQHGSVVGLLFLLLGIARFATEFWRVPDQQLGTLLLGFSMGQWLGILLTVVAVLLLLMLNAPTKNAPRAFKS